jgi:NodT family efflux transporter outer membrane factor (OMF) lipoprotein
MLKYIKNKASLLSSLCLILASCKAPTLIESHPDKPLPVAYTNSLDSTNLAHVSWRTFFADQQLSNLIDTALIRNQELQITLQDINISRNDVRLRQAARLPIVQAKLGAGVEKVGRYTSQGAGDATTDIAPGVETPEPLADFAATVAANWEVDVWKKLRNSKKAAVTRYLSTMEGKNFVLSNLVAEVANAYYELVALDNELDVVQQNIAIQKDALEIVKVQKQASRVTELAVQKFQAEVLKSQGIKFELLQQIKETENRINFLLGRYPTAIARNKESLQTALSTPLSAGVPSQLLANRPDIKQSELELAAAKLDVKVARAEFYPSFAISATLGFQAFKPSYLFRLPESLLYGLAGDLAAPLINRNAIKAEFNTANARQLQAMFNYERTILNAYMEVNSQLSGIENLGKRYDLKSKQVEALTKSIDLANDLFRSARADYLEVLMTQRDVLESKLELIETRKAQLNATVNIYKYLGGGWK